MKTTLTFCLLLLVALAGCGAVDTQPLPTPTATLSAPAQSSTVACALLTKADAESILGSAVDDPSNTTSTDQSGAKDEVTTCNYRQKAAPTTTTVDPASKQITLMVVNMPTVSETLKAFSDAQGAAGKKAEVVGGLGERAFWNTADKQLNVLRGDVWLIIIADSPTEKGSIDSARQVASLALGRIK